jgi:hypothetical protein
MTIHGFTLPALLESHLKTGGHKFSEGEMRHLKALLTGIDGPQPRLWGRDQIISQHQLWSSEAAEAYSGTEGTEYFPGRIDPKRILIIGEADQHDSPLALDYRTDEPRVVYLGDAGRYGVWIELAPSYEGATGILPVAQLVSVHFLRENELTPILISRTKTRTQLVAFPSFWVSEPWVSEPLSSILSAT